MKINNIAKNTSFFTLALILQKVISFSYFAILARNLIPEELGDYYFAISFTTIFAIFIDIGLANVLMREIAKVKKPGAETDEIDGVPSLHEELKAGLKKTKNLPLAANAQEILSSAMMIKLPLAIFSMVFVFLLINLMDVSSLTKILVYISTISMLLDSFTVTFYAVIRGHHNLSFESVGSVLFQLIVLVFGLVFLKIGMGLAWLMAALALASIFNFIYSGLLLNFKWHLSPLPSYKPDLVKRIFIITVPFGLFAIFQRAYMYLDTVFLKFMAGEFYVGLYQIAFKIVFALQFLPMAFIASAYPAFAKYYKDGSKQLPITFVRAMNYLIIISMPISAGVIAIADKVILLFRPEYADAVLPLQIIMVALVFIFINFPIGALLNATDRQNINTINMALALAISIVMNIILIPRFQTIGAAISVVVTNMFMFIFGMWHIPRIISFKPYGIYVTFLKTLSVTAVMLATILLMRDSYSLPILVLTGAAVYATGVILIRIVSAEDIRQIVISFKRG